MKNLGNSKKILIIELVAVLLLLSATSLTLAKPTGSADGSIQGVITAFTPPTPDAEGSITISNPITGVSMTLIIPEDSLSPEAIAWIQSAYYGGWPVEAMYKSGCDNIFYLKSLTIYPMMAPIDFFGPDSIQNWIVIK